MILPVSLEKLEYRKVLSYISRYCVTEKGRSRILALLPFEDKETAEIEGNLVTEAKEILIKDITPPLEYLPDLDETLSKSNIEGVVLDSKRILDILNLLIISRNTVQYLKNNYETAPSLVGITSRFYIDKMLEHHIQKVITENGEVKENASTKLLEIRREILSKKDELVKSVNRIVKNLSDKDIIREDYLTLRDGRVVIPVKSEHKRHLRGFIHSESATGQTVYIEPEETLELNNEIISLTFAERREIERILRELTKKIGASSAELKGSLSAVAFVDSVFARAKYSIEILGSYPQTDEKLPFNIINGRHPILFKKYGKQGTVPLSLTVDSKNVVLITGPNAGGKTVVLKTVGLLVLMVQSGIHITAEPDSNFHFFNNVLLDIGDQQSIEEDLSTFSSHLSNINSIINIADRKSLILLDEIGTGTDPTEGAALATAFLITLRDLEATVLATTHHGSLKLIANTLDGFENAAMEFDNENLKPTYHFRQGIPGSSYAFEIAKRTGFSGSFISLAEEYLDTDKHKVENFLVDIEAKSKNLEDKLKQLEIENSRLSGLSNLYKKNIDKLNEEKKEILKKAKSDADTYLKDINKKIEKVIKDLKESHAENNVIKESKNIIKEIKEVNKNIYKEEPQVDKDYKFQVGEFALIKNTQTTGEIIELNEAKNKASLKIGTLKMQAAISDLVPAKKEKAKAETESSFSHYAGAESIRLDIRGDKPEEAEFKVLRFVDNAYSSSLERIEILHGKGTGALKKTVTDILKKHDKVKSFYFAPIEFGGDGITIAELK